MSKRFAVLVGVDHVVAQDTLRAPPNDVDDWSKLLTALGFEGIRVAASPVSTNTAAVDDALRWLVNSVRDGGKDALGVFFYCGHGALRSGEGSALYLSDYAGQPPRAPGGPSDPLARDGSINLEDLRIQFAAHAPQGRLVAIVDTCRNTPHTIDPAALTDGHGLAFTWKQPGYPHLLLAATQRDQLSYERKLDGRWRGLLTWAVTTVLSQWNTGGSAGSDAYAALAPAALVDRAAKLIAAVQPSSEPQVPEVIGSPEALEAPFLATAAGHLSAEPVPAPGHEWDAGSVGTIVKNGTLKGWYHQTTLQNGQPGPLVLGFVDGVPTGPLGLEFVPGTLPNWPPCAATHVVSAAQWTSTNAAHGKCDPNKNICLQFTNNGLTWTWFKKTNQPIGSSLTLSFTTDAPSGGTWFKTSDNLAPI